MTTFRHIVATQLIERGSPIANLSQSISNGKKWTLVTPQRHLSKFEFDSKVDGASITPTVLFDCPPALFEFLEPTTIRYAGFPPTYIFLIFPFISPQLFRTKINERSKIFDEVKKEIVRLNHALIDGSSSSSELIDMLIKWKEYNTSMFPYMFLALMSDEIVLSAFEDIVKTIHTAKDASILLAKIFQSEYTTQAALKNLAIPILRSFTIPPINKIDDLYVPNASIADIKSYLDRFEQALLHNNDSFLKMFNEIHTLFAYIIYQISEENYYVWQSYALHINHVLNHIGNILAGSGKVHRAEDVLQMTVAQIVGLA